MRDKVNSRKKGAKAERKVAALLKKWTGREFSRTPASGGLRWKNANVVGDIVCTEERHFFPFAIEVKSYKDINFEHLLYLDDPKILKFWEQAAGDAERGQKLPLLFMRYNGMPSDFWVIAMTIPDFKNFKRYLRESYPYIVYKGIRLPKQKRKSLVLMSSHCLLQSRYKKVRKLAIQTIDEKWPQKD